MKKIIAGALVAGALVSVYGCQTTEVKETASVAKAEVKKIDLNNEDLYEVSHDGRHYVFNDFATYQDFLTVGETSFRKVFIGSGPHGQTLVYGLTNADKKKLSGISSVEMYEGKLAGADDFYGEVRAEDGRIYVFSELEDMAEFRKVGEAIFRFTQIGSGPQGQTVVYVLNGKNKKKQPVELMAKFKEINSL